MSRNAETQTQVEQTPLSDDANKILNSLAGWLGKLSVDRNHYDMPWLPYVDDITIQLSCTLPDAAREVWWKVFHDNRRYSFRTLIEDLQERIAHEEELERECAYLDSQTFEDRLRGH
jgi:hypothetical protein